MVLYLIIYCIIYTQPRITTAANVVAPMNAAALPGPGGDLAPEVREVPTVIVPFSFGSEPGPPATMTPPLLLFLRLSCMGLDLVVLVLGLGLVILVLGLGFWGLTSTCHDYCYPQFYCDRQGNEWQS